MSGRFSNHVSPSEAMQFPIHEWRQFLQRPFVALTPVEQQLMR